MIYPLFNPFAWLQTSLDVAAAFSPMGQGLRSGLLRHHVGNLHLVRPDACAACRDHTCERRRADYLKENPNEL